MNYIDEGKRLLKEFKAMRARAELVALSKYSLEHPLNDAQFARMEKLGKEVLGVVE